MGLLFISAAYSTVDISASKSSIRRFVITEKAPTRAFSWSLMIIALRTQFHVERLWGQRLLSIVFLNVKAEVAAFNHEKAQVGALSVIVKSSRTFVSSSTFYIVRTGWNLKAETRPDY